jgi:hypothetical protein
VEMITTSDLIYFSIGWVASVYLINCLIAGEFKRIKLQSVLLYVSTVAMVGTFGEVFWDGLYQKAFHVPLWQYYILPLHGAHTSYFAAILWGFYGFHLYLLYDTINKRFKRAVKYLPLIFSIEALLIEALVSITFKIIFGRWLYYYLPNGLWHVSAFQNFPLYVMAGYVILGTIKRFSKDPNFFIVMNLSLMCVLVFLV